MTRAIDNGDIPSIRSMASRMHADLETTMPAPAATPPTVAPPTPAAIAAEVRGGTQTQSTPGGDIYPDLQSIEDLLTGTDAERREGLDRLHQLVRRLRPY